VRRRSPAIEDDYEQEYHEPYVEQGQAIHPGQLAHFTDLMEARLHVFNQQDVKFLDVGCSTGRVLRLAKCLGFVALGLDFSKWAADHCAALGFETRHGSLIGQWPEAERFDIIHCCHTIEHVPDPVSYLREMARLLKPGGNLMISLPNYSSIPRILLRERWPVWCLDSHLWQFTARQMRRMVESQGLRILKCRTVHGYIPNNLWKRRLLDLAAAIGLGDGCIITASKP
jgi:2-polyprenyl-3-methyl-5-hydroxy-6-metoxy-1,4-benzoquinol methylase